MAAMKPRTGDGPLDAERDNHGVTVKIPLEGGGRMVLEMKEPEILELLDVLTKVLETK